jgi:hypothetical protein
LPPRSTLDTVLRRKIPDPDAWDDGVGTTEPRTRRKEVKHRSDDRPLFVFLVFI